MANVKVFGRIDGLTDGQFKTNMPPFGVCTTSCKEMLLCKKRFNCFGRLKIIFSPSELHIKTRHALRLSCSQRGYGAHNED
jgi:hypothetical protein